MTFVDFCQQQLFRLEATSISFDLSGCCVLYEICSMRFFFNKKKKRILILSLGFHVIKEQQYDCPCNLSHHYFFAFD